MPQVRDERHSLRHDHLHRRCRLRQDLQRRQHVRHLDHAVRSVCLRCHRVQGDLRDRRRLRLGFVLHQHLRLRTEEKSRRRVRIREGVRQHLLRRRRVLRRAVHRPVRIVRRARQRGQLHPGHGRATRHQPTEVWRRSSRVRWDVRRLERRLVQARALDESVRRDVRRRQSDEEYV